MAQFQCSEHGLQDEVCCITIEIPERRAVPEEEIKVDVTLVEPEEKIREHVKCSYADCKSMYWRPQDASAALSTIDLAQLHGWTILDRERGLLHCAWGH